MRKRKKRRAASPIEIRDARASAGRRPVFDVGILGFPQRLAQLIETSAGGSTREFARRCGLSEGGLRSYLVPRTYPTLDRLDALARAGGVSPGWLLGLDGNAAVAGAQLFDDERLAATLRMIESALTLAGVRFEAKLDATLVANIYRLLGETERVPRDEGVLLFQQRVAEHVGSRGIANADAPGETRALPSSDAISPDASGCDIRQIDVRVDGRLDGAGESI